MPQPADSDQTLSHQALLQVADGRLVSVHSGGVTQCAHPFLPSRGRDDATFLKTADSNSVAQPAAFVPPVQGAECGEGLQRRNLTCLVHWGDRAESAPQPVQPEFCGDGLVRRIQQEMEKPCFVPCPGEARGRYTQ